MSISSVGGFSAASIQQFQSKLFSRIDTNGDGTIDKSEFDAFNQKVEQKTGQTIDTSSLWSKLDPNNTGSVSESQFEANLPPPPSPLSDGTQNALIQLQSQQGDGTASDPSDTVKQIADQIVAAIQQDISGQSSGTDGTSGSSNTTSGTGASTSTASSDELKQLADQLVNDIEQAVANQSDGSDASGSTTAANTNTATGAIGSAHHGHHHHHRPPAIDATQAAGTDSTTQSSDAASQSSDTGDQDQAANRLTAQITLAISQYSASVGTSSGSQVSLAA